MQEEPLCKIVIALFIFFSLFSPSLFSLSFLDWKKVDERFIGGTGGVLWSIGQVRLPDYSGPKEAKLRANAKWVERGIMEGLGSGWIWDRECRSNGRFVRTK